MGRIIGKDEFKENMRFAAAEEEVNQMVEAPIVEDPEPEPKIKKAKTKSTKAAPVAAGPKRRKSKTTIKAEQINAKTVSDAMEKAAKQEEAIKASLKLINAFTDFLLKDAKERIETADRWADYTETLEKML